MAARAGPGVKRRRETRGNAALHGLANAQTMT